MRIRNVGRFGQEIKLMMTPMIDMVFLLLIFFLMTLKFSAPEGDFNIKMPASPAAQGNVGDVDTLPLKVRLRADEAGRLTAVYLGEARMADDAPFRQLRERILQIVGDDAGPGSVAADTEIELQCDYNLRFEYAIDAITAVSGRVKQGEIVRLIDKIRFAPPRPRD